LRNADVPLQPRQSGYDFEQEIPRIREVADEGGDADAVRR
jgi:hypothetical protein